METIIKFLKEHTVDLLLTAGAIVVTSILHWVGIFDFLELKTYDYRFHSVRGPLTGWRASDSTIINLGTDVVLVEVDDESWRLLQEKKVPWPYPRGDIWAVAVDNLTKAGARVIAFDIQFDSPDARSEYLRSVSNNLPDDFRQYLPGHGDIVLAESIKKAQANGTKVVMDVKMVRESSRIPPQYIAYPVPELMEANPTTGLINDMLDIDGFSREYSIAGYMDHEPGRAYLSLGMKCVKELLNIPDETVPEFHAADNEWEFGPLMVKSYGKTNNFLVNYYGPPSGYMMPGDQDIKPWGTFPRFSLAQVLDTKEFELAEDMDWMSQFLPGEIPEWILAMKDESERAEMMALMGLGDDFDVTQSPFYNKIVIFGVNVEVLHDVKSTPFYNYMGLSQLTPGMETHANAIQTILHKNYLVVFGGKITRILADGSFYPLEHFLLITLLCTIAYILLTKITLHPILAGAVILSECVLYFGVACGLFANDLWWIIKASLSSILPAGLHDSLYTKLQVTLPQPGETYVMPIVAPLAGIIFTYASNMIFQFLHEQKDKKFLRETFGTYIAPEVLDKMYEEKQAPKLGGVMGYHTAFFSDIQNFSTFSEVLEPERMVALMNEYLTVMSKVILDNEGTLDKYIGDAIVAFYGAPAPVENQEKKACEAALVMQEKLDDLREKWKAEGNWPDIVYSMRHRIGLNCGNMVTGNMGSDMRMNYTMMGDTVNLAARLESSAKQYGIYNFVGHGIYENAKDDYIFRFVDFTRVKGKNVPVKVYELVDRKATIEKKSLDLIKEFEKGMDLYFQQKWDAALHQFTQTETMEDHFTSRNTTPSAIFIHRCELFKENPPEKNWDGVWTMTTK